MSIENEIAGLTQSTTDLLEAVNTKKATLDTAVSNAQTAVTDATSQVSLAAAEKVGAQTARDTAESFKDQAYTYSQSAASAVAYQDLTAIAETKAETAVDVFVYDTSKDSDGGAWRQRTQHTSWYNETLNTATRGSRKEFPAVAVIVAESNKVTIYDGDDPSLPMWMVFNATGTTTNGLLRASTTSFSVAMLNGELIIGAANVDFYSFNFIKEYFYFKNNASTFENINGNEFSKRNDAGSIYPINSLGIVSRNVNDVAMTVLPDAPIDPATGLPIPTIAVATDGGVSVIKDDGSVVDITASTFTLFTDEISFTDENYVAFACDPTDSSSNRLFYIEPIPEADLVYSGFDYQNTTNASERYIREVGGAWTGDLVLPLKTSSGSSGTPVSVVKDSFVFGNSAGLGFVSRNKQTPSEGMSAVIKQDYNTGWMNGDIKLATLSDTDDTDLVGSELVTNGTFDTDISGWNNVYQSNISWDAGGYLHADNPYGTAARTGGAQTLTSLVIGKTYTVTATLVNNSGKVRIGISESMSSETVTGYTGSISHTFTATSTSHTIKVDVYRTGYGCSMDVDNISVRLAEPDRSVNNNGLQVFGTVAREPVATGADLVSYHTVSGGYLQADFGGDFTGQSTFAITFWTYATYGGGTFFEWFEEDLGSTRLQTFISSDVLRVVWQGRQALNNSSVGSSIRERWSNQCLIFDQGEFKQYQDGKLVHSQSIGVVTELHKLRLGMNNNSKMSLFRISSTLPTAEQIEKIYNDEKVLFQEGAQATLYGTSDAVTALAYDDTTELLHVGTSSGRSVFQGLKRVDNTTDAVGTAISASNNLVVEE